ncbi:MAG: hypothetical protein AAF417_06900 [Pseudomonadota bacterium]
MFPATRWIRNTVLLVVSMLSLSGAPLADDADEESITAEHAVAGGATARSFAVEHAAADDSIRRASATEYLVGVYYGHAARGTERRLLDTGLAQPEIDAIIDSVAQEFADCVVSSLVKADAVEMDVTIGMLADGVSIDEVSTYMDSLSDTEGEVSLTVFETEHMACSAGVNARHGLD